MQFDRQHWGVADGATIITLPIPPQPDELRLEGCHVSVSGAALLDELFALLDAAAITRVLSPATFSAVHIKISLTSRDATVAKLLFDGFPRADGSISGTVNGQPISANATLCRDLREWVRAQRRLAPECSVPT